MPAKSDEESIAAENGPDAGQRSSAEDVIEIQSNVMALDGDLKREFETCIIAVLKARKRAREAIEEYVVRAGYAPAQAGPHGLTRPRFSINLCDRVPLHHLIMSIQPHPGLSDPGAHLEHVCALFRLEIEDLDTLADRFEVLNAILIVAEWSIE